KQASEGTTDAFECVPAPGLLDVAPCRFRCLP
ncbi:hypothetical protein A2U01_0115477, partial [Trifolium medium]|nr:hypothetical protein [Trifolium medium]